MSQIVTGLVAHVDAGKTTLSEALLYHAGVTRQLGRVDKGSATSNPCAITPRFTSCLNREPVGVA